MFTKRQTAVFYVVAVLTTAFAGAVTYLELNPPKPPGNELERYHVLPAFQLTDQNGRQVSLDDLKGKVWLADFVYTTCPGPCPLITAHMAQLQRKLPPGADIRLVSISTDPQGDTPPVLKAYAEKFGATDRWTFLTGPKDQVYDLINHGFLLAASAPAGAPILHSTKMALVDRNGTVRAYYDGNEGTADPQILADMQTLLNE
jgi:protein SCO1/2